jgi:DNA-binding SARP family transcriptional activator
MVLITEDPQLVRDELRLQHDADGTPTDASRILYFGDPGQLPDTVTSQVAVVTLAYAPASDVTVVVDHRAASIHPLGRTVRPHLLRGETSSLVRELVAASPPDQQVTLGVEDDVASPEAEDRVSSVPRVRPGRTESSAVIDSRVEEFSFPGPGTVEVKLLTAAPRIEGLSSDLPANRARRGVELVSYLALHQGDEITSDRLRTRVLGSSDADAASKTLFNVATAARRALGTDPSGVPLFPLGTRTGHYRVTEGVTVDVHRAASLAAVGSATEDPNRAIALLRAALNLVEGEPMANVLSGYAWWEAEGHSARIAAVLVNAAGDLAALAVDAGLFDLAQWGLGQARLVDPYSEAISRAAMQVAAAAGDADRLRREWRDCQRRMDELDPGSAPSPRTERLYGELAQRVLVGAARVPDQ